MESDAYTMAQQTELSSEYKEYMKYGENDGEIAHSNSRLDDSEATKIDSNEGLSGSQETKLSELMAGVTIDEPVCAASNLSSADLEKKRMRRFLVTQEIYETERGYVTDLNNLVRNLLDPLNGAYLAGVAASAAKTSDNSSAATIIQNTTFGNEGGGGWITFDQKQAIIRNASHILRVQKLFCKMIEDAVKTPMNSNSPVNPSDIQGGVCSDPSVSQIAKCFLTMMPKLEAVYLPYCSQHDTAVTTLAQIKKNHANQLQAFLDECRSKMNTKLEIQDFLIKPVQRICKYPLLLKELSKGTPDGTQDKADILDALEKIKVLVGNINEQKKITENERKKATILSRLAPGSDIGISELGVMYGIQFELDARMIPITQIDELKGKMGKLLRGGGLFVSDLGEHELPFSAHSNSESNYFGLFLFPDLILILSARKSNAYILFQVIPTAEIINVQEIPFLSGSPGTEPLRNAWRITWAFEIDGKQIYHTVELGSKSDKDKEAWLLDMARVVSPDKFQLADDTSSHNQSISDNAFDTHRKTSAESSNSPPIVPNSSTEQDPSSALMAQTDMKFADVYTTESLLAAAKVAGAGSSTFAQRIAKVASLSSAMPSAANSASSLKGIFRRGSTSRNSMSGHDEKSRPSTGNQLRKQSIRNTPRTLSVFGGVSGSEDPTIVGSHTESPKIPLINDISLNDSGVNGLGQRRPSMSDMASAVKNLVRGRSNSVLNGDDKGKNTSKMSLAIESDDNDASKRWGSGIKAKILTVGKFSNSRRKSIAASNDAMDTAGVSSNLLPLSDGIGKNDDMRKSNSSLAPSVAESTMEKKKGLFASLGRSFSKRGKDKPAVATAKELFVNSAAPSSDKKNDESHLKVPSRPPPPAPETSTESTSNSSSSQADNRGVDNQSVDNHSGASGLLRRPGIRVVRKSDSGSETDEGKGNYTYKPAPPTSDGNAQVPALPRNQSSAARISAIRAKRSSKRDSQIYNEVVGASDPQPPASAQQAQ